jgi:hypothetical protein
MNPTLYEKDFHLWLTETASLLRERRFSKLDLPNLIEEIETLGRSEKRVVESNLVVLLIHLLKWKYQFNKRSHSWRYTIEEHRDRLHSYLSDSPSLQPYVLGVFAGCYQRGRRLAAAETGFTIDSFPTESPFTPEEALDVDYLPD